MRFGIALASSRGSSGTRRAAKRASLRRVQERRCVQSGGRLWKNAEVDHRMPLFRVWSELRDTPWPKLLDYWGLPNLQMINREVHAAKCADEARERSAEGQRHLQFYLAQIDADAEIGFDGLRAAAGENLHRVAA